MGPLIDLVPLSYTESVVVLGAAILGLAAGVLGSFAVLRERSLVGDAIAHAALPGVAIAFILTGSRNPEVLLAGAAVAGVIGALAMVGIEQTSRIRPDAAIGVVLSGFFSIGIVLLTYIAGFNNASQAGLQDFLFGQAAGMVERDLVVMGLLAAAGCATVALGFRVLKATLFDPAFAGSVGVPVRLVEVGATALLVVAIVIGLRAVGAILMVAMLVVPTVAARQLADRLALMLPLAAAIGAGVGASGALIAARMALPTGPVIVCVGFATAIAAVLLAPGRGVAWQWRRRAAERRRAAVEGVLVDLETAMHAGPPPTAEELRLAGGRGRTTLRRALRDLDRAGMLEGSGGRLVLTEAGAAAAHAVLERRGLWGLWLEHGWALDLPDAREPDPRDLAGSLGSDAVERLHALARRSG